VARRRKEEKKNDGSKESFGDTDRKVRINLVGQVGECRGFGFQVAINHQGKKSLGSEHNEGGKKTGSFHRAGAGGKGNARKVKAAGKPPAESH